MIAALVPVLAPILVAVIIGFSWARLKQPFDVALISRLAAIIGTPCLAFSVLTSRQLELTAFLEMAGIGLVSIFASGIAGAVILRACHLPVRQLLPSIMMPNTGNMGLPVTLYAFGEAGLSLAICVTSTVMVAHHTIGVMMASGSFNPWNLATQPILYAVALALSVIVTGWPVPEWIANTTALLGAMTIPLMLLSLGVSLAKLRISNLGTSAVIAATRLILGPLIGIAVVGLMGLEGYAAGVVLVQTSMPVAVFNYLYAARYGGPAEEVAGAVILSTLGAFLLLPFLLIYALTFVP